MNFSMLDSFMIFDNSALELVKGLIVFLLVLLLLKLFQLIILARLKKLAEKTETDVDDALVAAVMSVSKMFYIVIAFYFGARYVTLPELADKIIRFAVMFVIVYDVIEFFRQIIRFSVEKYFSSAGKESSGSILRVIDYATRVALWALGALVILSNLGVNVTSLIASLGIGGIAIALAVQNILGDMFSSIAIFVDKPFEEGDFITFDTDKSGTVQKIGLKTTRVKTLRGEELVVPNDKLTMAHIHNLKRMESRREVLTFGITYETKGVVLSKIPKIVKEEIKKVKGVKFDRCHFSMYTPSSLDFETVYYVESADYKVYMDAKQKVNVNIFKRFAKEGISFAYPTQTLHVHKKD